MFQIWSYIFSYTLNIPHHDLASNLGLSGLDESERTPEVNIALEVLRFGKYLDCHSTQNDGLSVLLQHHKVRVHHCGYWGSPWKEYARISRRAWPQDLYRNHGQPTPKMVAVVESILPWMKLA